MTPSTEQLTKAFSLVAFSSLKENGESTSYENIETEAARIERCVEYYYRKEKNVTLDYPEFAGNFLQKNFKDIVFGDKFLGFFLDDVEDDIPQKEYYLDEMAVSIGGK